MKKLLIFAVATTILPVVLLTVGVSMGVIPESVVTFLQKYGIFFILSTIIIPASLPIVLPMLKSRQRKKAQAAEKLAEEKAEQAAS